MAKPKWKLVQRTCKCGCGRSWKCLPDSPNLYCMLSHNPAPHKQSIIVTRVKVGRIYRWLNLVAPKDEED